MEMFKYLYEYCSYLWGDDQCIIYFLQGLFKSSVRTEDCIPWVEALMKSETSHALFKGMSFSYRFLYVESLMKIHDMAHLKGKLNLYTTIGECLAEEPYGMYFLSIFIEKFCPKMQADQIDNFIPLLEEAFGKISNNDIDLFIKYGCVERELISTGGNNAPLRSKWWERHQKRNSEIKRASTLDQNDIVCKAFPNCEGDEGKEGQDNRNRFTNKDLETIIDKFEKKIRSHKNYNYYTYEPDIERINGERSSSVSSYFYDLQSNPDKSCQKKI